MTEDERKPLLHGDDEPSVVIRTTSFKQNCYEQFTNPNCLAHRIVVLSLMCFLSFGSYFCYDTPAALHDQFIDDLDMTESAFMQLYSWYSWPNVILCFFGGFLLDRIFGVRLGTIIFSLFVLFGQLLFALGAMFKKVWLMYLGRFVFGIGGESLAVAQNTYAVVWFKEKELNLVFGLQLSMARIGSTVNMNLMEPVYVAVKSAFGSNQTLGISLLFAAITCVFSLCCGLVLAYLDKRAERILERENSKTDEVIKITDVKDFSFQLWMIFLVCVFYYVAVFPFIGLGKVFFEEKFGFSPASASAVNRIASQLLSLTQLINIAFSIVYILSAPCSPALGFMVDRVGRNVFWVIVAVLTTLGSHGLLTFTFLNPWFGMCLMGVSYSLLACALWPMVASLVPMHQVATAYGFMQSVQNLGLAVVSLIAGSILDSSGYFILEIFFCTCLILGFICSLLLYVVDLIRGSGLNLSAELRNQKKECEDEKPALNADDLYKPSPHLLEPRTAFGIRNRYYSRIGAQIPEHLLAHTSLKVNPPPRQADDDSAFEDCADD